jgi:flagellar biosynthesis protein FlhA
VVFVILVVINFVVITKGAGRIAEVSARFALDAMPGKQMAIDADLNAGLIGEAEARKRRAEIAQEADFYGSMDGASKFVRGDAIAGILILFINIVGGFAVGMIQHNLSFAQAANNYILLAIGDGLVAQVPALVISTAAGLVVSRVGTGEDIGRQLGMSLTRYRHALYLTAAVLGLLGLIPGMPHLSFLLLAAGTGGVAWWLDKRSQAAAAAPKVEQKVEPETNTDASWSDVAPLDVLGLEVGYRLISLVDKTQGGELLGRIKALRRKFAQEVGFLPPSVHIRDNLELKPGGYRVLLKGVVVAEGEAMPGAFLAINPGRVSAQLPGTPTRDPAFGLPATWIDAPHRDQAIAAGFTVVDASTVIATHISQVLHSNAAQLLGRQEVASLVEHFGRDAPKLIEELVPKVLPLGLLQRVLQNLLAEGVAVRDLRSVIETLGDAAARTQDPNELTAAVRQSLGPAIVQSLYGSAPELNVIILDPELERVLAQAIGAGDGIGLEPGIVETLLAESASAVRRQEARGHPSALLVPDRLRAPLARLLRRAVPNLKVLAHAEMPDTRSVRVSVVLGARGADQGGRALA